MFVAVYERAKVIFGCGIAVVVIGIASVGIAREGDAEAESSSPEFRLWRSADGKHSEEAALDFVADGYVHVLRRSGKRGKIAISLLSEEDQKHIAATHAAVGGLFEDDDTVPQAKPKTVVVRKPVIELPLPVNGISPDQEAYNNLMSIAYGLESGPLDDERVKSLRFIRQKALSPFMQEKVSSLGELLKSLGNIESKIARRKQQAEADSSGAGFQKGLEGGLEGAGALAQFDVAANGEPAAGALAYMVAGAIGGAVRAQQAAAMIQEEADQECSAMREQQKELVRVWIRDMEEMADSLVGRSFVAERLIKRDGPAKHSVPDANGSPVQRWGDWLKLRVATLSPVMCDLENSDPLGKGRKLPTPIEWQEMIDLAIAEWPTCVDQRSPYFASLLKMRAKALLSQEKIVDAEEAVCKSISFHAEDHDAYVLRARVYFNSGRTPDGLRDVETAIRLDPQNSSHRLFRALGHALNRDAAGVYRSLKEAYDLGWNNIDFVRKHDVFQPFKDEEEFNRLTTVKWSWTRSTGLLAGDVYLTNDSPFPITNVRLKVLGSGQQPVLESAYIGPGQQMHWEWVDNTVADATQASMECDQTKK